jgi:hypothetical protein
LKKSRGLLSRLSDDDTHNPQLLGLIKSTKYQECVSFRWRAAHWKGKGEWPEIATTFSRLIHLSQFSD